MKPQRIALDGPAGAGKSTVGELLAQRLGYLYFDTGAMYRAVTWLALHEQVDISDGAALAELTQCTTIVVRHPTVDDGRQYTVLTNGQDVTWEIRQAEVTRSVSTVSAHPAVRTLLRAKQRAIGLQGHVVMVGRDIGTVVLPEAELKIFLTASPEERARRRHRELVARLGGHHPQLASWQEVLQDIRRRDALDSPNMQPASDAIEVVTDHLTVVQVLDTIYTCIEALVFV